ncbi:MAG: DUF2334 domain-containing protein [Acidobacteriia bacterium]|nr:DUF2334 domain-containing protein [Terriglobia bacterium]
MDDLCPAPAKVVGADLGCEPGGGVSKELENLLREFPHIGITFFVIPDFRRSPASRGGYAVNLPQNSAWVKYYLEWARKYQVEFGVHGLHHFQRYNPFFGKRLEYAFATPAEARASVHAGLGMLTEAGFDVRGFRQPGWDINSDLSLISAVRSAGLLYVAGSSLDAGLNSQRQRVSNLFPTGINGLVNMPQNIELDWPLARMCEEAARIQSVRGIISVKAHVADRGNPNALTEKNLCKLRRFLDFLGSGRSGEIEYATFEKIAALAEKSLASIAPNAGEWDASLDQDVKRSSAEARI